MAIHSMDVIWVGSPVGGGHAISSEPEALYTQWGKVPRRPAPHEIEYTRHVNYNKSI
jgi:hypothetical protein